MEARPAYANGSTFLTSHAAVVLVLAEDPYLRVRDIADVLGLTERHVHLILRELKSEGYVKVEKVGRRNRYVIDLTMPLKQFPWRNHSLRDLVAALVPSSLPGAPGVSPLQAPHPPVGGHVARMSARR